MRVVVVTRIPQVLLGFTATLEALGHETVALLTQGPEQLGPLIAAVPEGANVLMPGSRQQLAPLLRAVDPDLVLCMGFPWKIPPDALAVPRLGWLNGHPGLLPSHKGPIPVAWAIRHGDAELGITFHFMDAELDTGPIVSQRTMTIGDYVEPEAFYPRMGETVGAALLEALQKIDAGDLGEPQEPGSGEYESFFVEDDVWLDLGRPRDELHRLVWAWRYAIPAGTEQGALLELDGERTRVLATSLVGVDGARRVEAADGPLWLVRTEPAAPPSA
ncbi:MAG: formyltransferase family protein [Actinomycetota bacterium]